ncbi:DNA polymerase [Caldanaerobius polysaccharolyticus]|uniref:DNA polymerase n=1 Tax=Caldanaerobius polysaccharolyticus TaxID=44256 RepID=UPI00047D7025|nr:DNA polymerase [Caldanaerobius polysaccharolyticus]
MQQLIRGKDACPVGANCDSCGLREFPFVPGYGPDTAEVVIVGEAPGDTEVMQGKPFVGKAGQLLSKVLEEAEIDRTQCYITNSCLCRPIPHRAPKAAEIKACRERLIGEVKERLPKVVIALGNAAVYALIGRANISDVHGTMNWCADVNAYVVPTYHPAAVLRSPSLYVDLIRDVKRAASLLTEKKYVTVSPDVEYVTLHTYDHILELVERLKSVSEVAIDVETASNSKLLCIGLSWKCNTAVVVTQEALADPRTVPLLDEALKDKKLIGHNLKYDIQVLWRNGFTTPHVGADTMLMHYTLDERPGEHKLKPLVRRYLNLGDYDAPIKEYYSHMEDCPPNELWKYNAYDAASTLALQKVLEQELDSDATWLLHNMLYPAANVLARVEYTGVLVDRQYLQETATKLKAETQALEQEMFQLAGREFNPRSPKQLVQLLYYDLKLPIPNGKYSTDEESLMAVQEFHPLPAKILEYRGKVKMLRTYVDALLEAADEDGRVRTTFNLHGTVTGRLSSSNPINLQNIPKTPEARNSFIATPGYTLVEGDLSQAEVRVLAWYCKDPNLIKALSEGGDMHIRTASIMFRKKPEEVTPEMRQAAKRITFGLIYGKTVESLARDLGISVTEAQELYDRFFAAFPRVKEWIHAQQQLVLATGVTTTPFRRKRHFDLITGENRSEVMRQAVNTPIQSTASDITLSAIIRIGHQLQNNPNTRMLLTVHDSILLETKEDPVEVARWLKQEMVGHVLDGTIPFDAEVKIGQRWGSLEEVK